MTRNYPTAAAPAQSAQRQFEAWSRRTVPDVEHIFDGVWSVPMTLPGPGPDYTLGYLIEGDDGFLLVDAGFYCDPGWEALETGLARAGGTAADIRAVVVTHAHPDHYGLVVRLRETWQLPVWAHVADGEMRREFASARARRLLERCGVPQSELDAGEGELGAIRYVVVDPPPIDRFLSAGEEITWGRHDLRVLWTPGHTAGHICLHAPALRALFSGDHLLPRLTPNVSAPLDLASNPLATYLTSLADVAALDIDVTLPAHEYRFTNPAARARQIADHHESRLEEISTVLRSGSATCWMITERLPWSRPWRGNPFWVRMSATREVLAHLLLMQSRGLVDRNGADPLVWSLAA